MPNPVERLRTLRHHTQQVLRMHLWFPHVPLAILIGAGGLWLLRTDLGASWQLIVDEITRGERNVPPRLLPPLLIGGGLLAMALGLLLRSRVAWIMALLLSATAAAGLLFAQHHQGQALLVYFLAAIAALLAAWRQFDRASLAASTLFALTSVAMLVMYAAFGSFYLGSEFKPPIDDLVTALYFSMVTMSTVGYGDITPQTSDSRLFTVSIIVLGVAVFATSLTAVIAPLVSRSLQRIVNRRGRTVKRENHFIVIGNTALAVNTSRELAKRGRPVTRILRKAPEGGESEESDLVIGEPGNTDVLRQAGAEQAKAVLAMTDDDSENAFVVLAVKELRGPAQTIVAVNDAHHLDRIKLVQPDVTIAPPVLGGELMAMVLTGEAITGEFLLRRLFQNNRPPSPS